MIRKLTTGLVTPLMLVFSSARADDDAQFEQARIHLQKGRFEEALENYEALEKAKADVARTAIGKSRVFQAQGRWTEATRLLENAARDIPRNADLWARLADLQFQQGRYDDARDSIGRALKIDRQQPLARLIQAQIDTETGRITEAQEGYRWFVRYYNRVQPTDADTLLWVARGAVQYARWKRVSQVFSFVVNTLCPDALKADKHRWQAYYLSGALLLEKYNRAEAIPEFRRALAINSRAAPVLVALGIAAFQKYDLAEAEKYAERALKINPRQVDALRLQADIRLLGGQPADAERLLNTALSVNPHDQRTLARMAACYLLIDGFPPQEQFDELLANLDAVGALKIQRPSRFAKLVVELAARNPRPGYFLTILAEILEGRSRYDVAERLYRYAMTSMPQLAEPKTSLGLLLMRVGKTVEARKTLDEAFRADPFHVRVSNMRKVLKLLDGYHVITTDHFVIRVDSAEDKILGEYMAEYLEEIYGGLVKQFGYEPPQRTQFEIFHNGRGLSAHQWFSARMVGLPWIQTIGASTGVVVALASPTASNQPFNWARVLKHEFVHIITLQKTRFNIPRWFTEALAVESEGYRRPAIWNKLLIERVPNGELATLENLNDRFIRPKSPLDLQFAYCQSRLYVQYISEKYGEEKIQKLLEAYRNNTSTSRAVRQVFGVDQSTFEKGYRDYLNRIVAELTVGEPQQEKPPDELEKAYRADPENPQAMAEYARALLQLRKRTQARTLAGRALQQDPKNPVAAVVMAQLQMRAQDLPGAIRFLKPALDRTMPDRRVLALLAKLKLLDDEFSEAAELFELGRRTFPHDVELWKGLAAAYLKLDETQKLQTVLKELVLLDPDDAALRKKLAEIALDQKRYAAAIDYGRRALQIDVLDVELHRILGKAYRGNSQPERSIKEFLVALELKPNDLELELQLAHSYVDAGRKSQAKSRLESILKRRPNHPDARKLLKTLD